jgi:hypothetical protein
MDSISGTIFLHLPSGQELTLETTSGEKLYLGDHIVFSRGEAEVAVYAVYCINGSDVYASALSESSKPKKGDSFDIVAQDK